MNAWDIKREMAIPIWQDRIRACRASGMSIDLWCAANNISRKTYYRWEKLCVARAPEITDQGEHYHGKTGTTTRTFRNGITAIQEQHYTLENGA